MYEISACVLTVFKFGRKYINRKYNSCLFMVGIFVQCLHFKKSRRSSFKEVVHPISFETMRRSKRRERSKHKKIAKRKTIDLKIE